MVDSAPEARADVRLRFAWLGRGLAGSLFGLLLMTNVHGQLGRTAAVLIAYLFADGLLTVYAAKHARATRRGASTLAVVAVMDGLAALIALAFPMASALRLVGGARAILTGALDARWSDRHKMSDLLTLGGIAALALGAVTLAWPGHGLLALSWLLGLQVIVSGSLFVAGALSELRNALVAPRPA